VVKIKQARSILEAIIVKKIKDDRFDRHHLCNVRYEKSVLSSTFITIVIVKSSRASVLELMYALHVNKKVLNIMFRNICLGIPTLTYMCMFKEVKL